MSSNPFGLWPDLQQVCTDTHVSQKLPNTVDVSLISTKKCICSLWTSVTLFFNWFCWNIWHQTVDWGQVTDLACHNYYTILNVSMKNMSLSKYFPTALNLCASVYPTDLQSAVEEAAVLSRLVAQAFAGCNRGHGSRGHQPLRRTYCSAARRKIVPLPRHPYLDAPVSTVRRGRGGAADQAPASMSLPWERTRENER